jgi:hypothetical protein
MRIPRDRQETHLAASAVSAASRFYETFAHLLPEDRQMNGLAALADLAVFKRPSGSPGSVIAVPFTSSPLHQPLLPCKFRDKILDSTL